MFSGFNVNTIAIEIPISEITKGENSVVGMYASTSRPEVKKLGKGGKVEYEGKLVQVARMANPLVNELLIGTGEKDVWNATAPENESLFVNYYLNPRLAGVINAAFGTSFATTNRYDLVSVLLKYAGQPAGRCSRANRCADLLRLDLSVTPTAPEKQKRLTVLAGDSAGFPNGRRVSVERGEATLLSPNESTQDGRGAEGNHRPASAAVRRRERR
jgi:hypothetical protein